MRGKSKIRNICSEQGEDVLIAVEDNGRGMEPKQKVKLEKALQKGGRVGFGLTAVHERVKLYFGKEYGVKVDSEYGKGTRVEVRFSKEIRGV